MSKSTVPYLSDEEAISAIIDIGKKLYNAHLVASNDGNISARVSENAVWITPTGISKGELTPDILLKVSLSGDILCGTAKKSSETAMHLRLYKENPDVRVAVHAHPPFATSFAVARIPLDAPIYPEAHAVIGPVPIAKYATPGSEGVADSIAPYARSHNAVLLANHGALTWGETPKLAWFRMESLEGYARITMYSKYILGTASTLSPEELEKVPKFRG